MQSVRAHSSIASLNDSKSTTKRYLWKCKYCLQSYTTSTALQRHFIKYREHQFASAPKKNLTVHKCSQCERIFSNESILKMHFTRMHSTQYSIKPQKKTAKSRPIKKVNVVRKCSRCPSTFTDSGELRRHFVSKHMKENMRITKIKDDQLGKMTNLYHCNYCGQSYTIYNSLLGHFKHFPLHRTSKSVVRQHLIKCQHCSRTFSSNANLNLHVGRMHKQKHATDKSIRGTSKINCKLCSKHFNSYPMLREHMASVHDCSQLFYCDFCNSKYKYKHNLVRHQKANPSHISEHILKPKSGANKYLSNKVTLRLFKCKACSKVYTSIKELSNHQKKHAKVKRRPVATDDDEESDTDCQENQSESDYDRNSKRKTSNKQTKNKSIIKIENSVKIANTHKKIDPSIGSRNQQDCNENDGNVLRCLWCNKCYTITTIFEQHLLLHQDLRIKKNLFECKKCDSNFSHKSLLESHAAVHKFFQCDLCNKLFNEKAILLSHAKNCLRQFKANFMEKLKAKE